jgi:hypothetical protein
VDTGFSSENATTKEETRALSDSTQSESGPGCAVRQFISRVGAARGTASTKRLIADAPALSRAAEECLPVGEYLFPHLVAYIAGHGRT